MKVFIMVHQYGRDVKNAEDITVEIIGVYKNSKESLIAFHGYLDALEGVWREGHDGNPVAFNRFSEKTGDILVYASCDGHAVWITEEEVQ